MKYIVKELDLVATNASLTEPIYKIVGYTDTHLEAYKHCMNGKQYTTKDSRLIIPGGHLNQFKIVEVAPLNKGCVTINCTGSMGSNADAKVATVSQYEFDIIEVPINLADTRPIDYVGKLFKNKNSVFNIPATIDDVMKSHTWFGNMPVDLHLVMRTFKAEDLKTDDWLINEGGIIRKYYKGMVVTSAMSKIVRSTNATLKLPFSLFIISLLNGTTDAKFIKAAFAAEVNKQREQDKFNEGLKILASGSKTMKTSPLPTPTTKTIWTTFEGKSLDMDTIDHQHLSNIYWYTRIFSYEPSPAAIAQLKKRFNSEILEYKPLLRFPQEIQGLERKGYLKWENKGDYWLGTITYDGRKIGSIMKVR